MLQQLSERLRGSANAISQMNLMNVFVSAVGRHFVAKQTAQAYYCGFICVITEECDGTGEHTAMISASSNCAPPFALVPQGYCC